MGHYCLTILQGNSGYDLFPSLYHTHTHAGSSSISHRHLGSFTADSSNCVASAVPPPPPVPLISPLPFSSSFSPQSIGMVHSGLHNNPLNQTCTQHSLRPKVSSLWAKYAVSQSVRLMVDYCSSVHCYCCLSTRSISLSVLSLKSNTPGHNMVTPELAHPKIRMFIIKPILLNETLIITQSNCEAMVPFDKMLW